MGDAKKTSCRFVSGAPGVEARAFFPARVTGNQKKAAAFPVSKKSKSNFECILTLKQLETNCKYKNSG